MSDPYVYPGTDVLRNNLGIRDAAGLARVEADLTNWNYRLDWQLADPQRNIDASVAAMQGNEKPLRELLSEIATPLDS